MNQVEKAIMMAHENHKLGYNWDESVMMACYQVDIVDCDDYNHVYNSYDA